MRGKRAVRLQFATRRQLLWGRKWDVELWRLDDAREAKEKKERIIIKSERKGFIFDRQFAGIWMYAWVVDFLLSLDEKKEEGVSLGTRANSLVKRLR